MKKNKWTDKVKKMMATAAMACMLLAVVGVSSNADAGIMPCDEFINVVEEL